MPKRKPEVTLVRFMEGEEFGEPHLWAKEIDRDEETVTYEVKFPLFGRERGPQSPEIPGQMTVEDVLEAVKVDPRQADDGEVDDDLAAAVDEEMPDLPS